MDTLIVSVIAAIALLLLVRARLYRNRRRPKRPAGGCGSSCPGCCLLEKKDLSSSSLLVVGMSMLLIASTARAADTTDVWAQGQFDIDLYMGVSGLGQAAQARTVNGELMLGYGIHHRLSSYLRVGLEGSDSLSVGTASIGFGLMVAAYASEHFDIDLFFEICAEEHLRIQPSLEINVDSDDDLSGYGSYLRTGVAINGHRRSEALGQARSDVDYHINSEVGVYYTLARRHQLLVEFSWDVHPQAQAQKGEIGGVSLGYNVALGRAIELISEIAIDIPGKNEQTAASLMLGLISTFGP
ncbi:MAG: hypothetical protein H6707_02630 [Deltaproteobacteria bacterium]|nr:hypothetical protein [Deltaproteobacteria bacterium]